MSIADLWDPSLDLILWNENAWETMKNRRCGQTERSCFSARAQTPFRDWPRATRRRSVVAMEFSWGTVIIKPLLSLTFMSHLLRNRQRNTVGEQDFKNEQVSVTMMKELFDMRVTQSTMHRFHWITQVFARVYGQNEPPRCSSSSDLWSSVSSTS